MKTRTLIFSPLLVLSVSLSGQNLTTIFTPNGSKVPDTYLVPEFSAAQIESANNYVTANYPNAIRITNASATYNCHGYAWHISEGGNNVWIGYNTTTSEDIYWDDGSYIEVCNPNHPFKISYSSDNHSAISTAQAGIFKSKWGKLPVMQHQANYTPYSSFILRYYQQTPKIIGSNNLCTTANYQVNNLPANATVTWSTTGALQITGSNTANPVTVSKLFNGTGTLSANITSNCSNKTISKTISVGAPASPTISATWKDWIDGSSIIFSVPYVQGVSHQWKVDGYANPNATGSTYMISANSCYGPYPIQIYWTVEVTETNSCGSTTQCQNFKLSCDSYPKLASVGNCNLDGDIIYDAVPDQDFMIYPNPGSDMLTITQKDLNSPNLTNKGSQRGAFSVSLYNENGILKREAQSQKGEELKVNTSNLSSGIYYLHIQQGNNLIRKQIIIQH